MPIKASKETRDAVRYQMLVEINKNNPSRAVGTKYGKSHFVPTAQIVNL